MTISGETIQTLLEKRGAYPEWAQSYGEPGYDNAPNGVILANWNRVHKRVYSWLEHHGYALEWSDEWIQSDSGKIYRSTPDCHGWKPSFVITDRRSEVIGRDEIEAGDCLDEYEEHLLNNPKHADTFDVDWTERGFVKLNEDEYESGFHPGQTDDPTIILAKARKADPNADYLFSIDGVGQFDMRFSIWKRARED